MSLSCLIIDDNSDFLDAARRLLEGQGIDVVGTASTTAEAIRRVSMLRPDVTLVDVNLGEEDGTALARHLTASRGSAGTRVILISTYEQGDLVEARDHGQTIPFVSKVDLSGAAIRSALGLESDDASPESGR